MTWSLKLRRCVSLGMAVGLVGGSLLAGGQWAQQHALSLLLGPGARASAVTLHWSRSAGCAEDLSIPLTTADAPGAAPVEMTAGRMWFTYDFPALLRKRLILPRVVIEDARFDVTNTALRDRHAANPAGTDAKAPHVLQHTPDRDPWLSELQQQLESLEREQFLDGTQVAVDTAMVSEQWRAECANIVEQAQRILAEARDIQNQLTTMNNVLRNEGQVVASRQRLAALKASLVAMKSDLARAERTVRERQSNLREALLIEKNSLRDQGLAYQAPPADQLAATTIETWIAGCLREPLQVGRLLQHMLDKPYLHTAAQRGSTWRTFDARTAEVAVRSARISGELATAGSMAPFVALGSFEMLPHLLAGPAERVPELAQWRMSVDAAQARYSISARSEAPGTGTMQLSLASSGPGEIRVRGEIAEGNFSQPGTGQLRLQQWLAAGADHLPGSDRSSSEPLLAELIDTALSDSSSIPPAVEFRLSGSLDQPAAAIDAQSGRWLSARLAEDATRRVAQGFEAAAERLEARIHRDLNEQNRTVAVGRNDTLQRLDQELSELRAIEASVLQSLQQRSGAQFARQPQFEVLQ